MAALLRGVVADQLSQRLGQFVQDLKAEDLQVGILGGDVRLGPLVLKATALDSIAEVPATVRRGVIGQLVLKVPWRELKSKPVHAVLEDVHIVLAPNFALSEEFNAPREAERELARRLQRLASAENIRWMKRSSAVGGDGNGKEGSEKQSMIQALVTKVIDNIQVTVNRVHIRIESPSGAEGLFTAPTGANATNGFAAGVCLHSLSIKSTNSTWKEMFIENRVDTLVYKLGRLEGLSLYWNRLDEKHGVELGGSVGEASAQLDIPKWVASMSRLIARETHAAHADIDHDFLLRPVNGQLRLTLDTAPKPNTTRPKVRAELSLDEVAVELGDTQFRSALMLASSASSFEKARKYQRFRPTGGIRPSRSIMAPSSVIERLLANCHLEDPAEALGPFPDVQAIKRGKKERKHKKEKTSSHKAKSKSSEHAISKSLLDTDTVSCARAWWHYAITAVLSDVRDRVRRRSWSYMLKRRKLRQEYIALYKRKLAWAEPAPEMAQAGIQTPGWMLDARDFVQALSPTDLARSATLEHELEVEDILFFQTLAEAELEREARSYRASESYTEEHKRRMKQRAAQEKRAKSTADKAAGKPEKRGWFSWATGSSQSAQDNVDASPDQETLAWTLSDADREELYSTIDFSEAVDESSLPKDYIQTIATVGVQRSSVSVWERIRNRRTHKSAKSALASAELRGLGLRASLRPAGSLLAFFRVEDFIVKDSVTKHSGARTLVSLAPSTVGDSERAQSDAYRLEVPGWQTASDNRYLLDVMFEQKPLDGHADLALNLRLLPLDVVVPPPQGELVTALRRFISVEDDTARQQQQSFAQAASSYATAARTASAAQLKDAIDQHKTMDLRLEIDAPNIVVPFNICDRRSNFLLLDLGQLSLSSNLSEVKPNSASDLIRTDDLYDRFTVRLSDVSAVLVPTASTSSSLLNRTPDWRLVSERRKMGWDLIEPITVSLQVDNCIATSAFEIPRLRVRGRVPSFAIDISPQKMRQLMLLISTLTAGDSSDTSLQELPTSSNVNMSSDIDLSVGIIEATAAVSETMPPSRVLIDASISLNRCLVTLSESPSAEVVRFVIENLTLSAIQRPNDVSATLLLDEIRIEDCRELARLRSGKVTSGTFPYLLSTNLVRSNESAERSVVGKGGEQSLLVSESDSDEEFFDAETGTPSRGGSMVLDQWRSKLKPGTSAPDASPLSSVRSRSSVRNVNDTVTQDEDFFSVNDTLTQDEDFLSITENAEELGWNAAPWFLRVGLRQVKPTHPDYQRGSTADVSATVHFRSLFIVVQQYALARILTFLLSDLLPSLAQHETNSARSTAREDKRVQPADRRSSRSNNLALTRSVVACVGVRASIVVENISLLLVDNVRSIRDGIYRPSTQDDHFDLLGQFAVNDMRLGIEMRYLSDKTSGKAISDVETLPRHEALKTALSVSSAEFTHNLGPVATRNMDYNEVLSVILATEKPEDASAAQMFDLAVAGDLGVDPGLDVFPVAISDSSAMLRFMFTQTKGVSGDSNTAPDFGVWMRTNSVRVIFVNRDVQYFVAHFLGGPLLPSLQTPSSISDLSENKVEDLSSSDSFAKTTMLLDILVRAPELIIPQSFIASEHVVISFGVIRIASPKPESTTFSNDQRYTLSVDDVRASTYHNKVETQTENGGSRYSLEAMVVPGPMGLTHVPLLKRVSLSLDARMRQEQPDIAIPQTEVDLQLSDMDFVISPEQVGLLLRIMSDNLQESGDHVSVRAQPATSNSVANTAAELASLPEQNQQVYQDLHVHARLRVVRLTLLAEYAHKSGSQVDDSIAALQLSDFTAELIHFSNSTMKGDVGINDFSIKDTRRGSRNKFKGLMSRGLITPSDHSSNSRLFEMKFEKGFNKHRSPAVKSTNSSSTLDNSTAAASESKVFSASLPHFRINARLSHLELFIIPDLLRDIVSSVSASLAELSAKPKTSEIQSLPRQDGPRAIRFVDLSTVSATFEVESPQIILLDDAADRSTLAVCLRLDIATSFEREVCTNEDPIGSFAQEDTIEFVARRVRIVVDRPGVLEPETPIIKRFDLEVDMRQSLTQELQDTSCGSQQVSVVITPIGILFAHSDVILLQRLLAAIQTVLQPYQEAAARLHEQDEDELRAADSCTTELIPYRLPNTSPENRVQTSEARPSVVRHIVYVHESRMSASFTCPSIVATLIEDGVVNTLGRNESGPLLEVRLLELLMSLGKDELLVQDQSATWTSKGNSEVDASLRMCIDYFSQVVRLYEPFLEPIQLEVRLREMHDATFAKTDVNFVVPDRLDVNLSPPLLDDFIVLNRSLKTPTVAPSLVSAGKEEADKDYDDSATGISSDPQLESVHADDVTWTVSNFLGPIAQCRVFVAQFESSSPTEFGEICPSQEVAFSDTGRVTWRQQEAQQFIVRNDAAPADQLQGKLLAARVGASSAPIGIVVELRISGYAPAHVVVDGVVDIESDLFLLVPTDPLQPPAMATVDRAAFSVTVHSSIFIFNAAGDSITVASSDNASFDLASGHFHFVPTNWMSGASPALLFGDDDPDPFALKSLQLAYNRDSFSFRNAGKWFRASVQSESVTVHQCEIIRSVISIAPAIVLSNALPFDLDCFLTIHESEDQVVNKKYHLSSGERRDCNFDFQVSTVSLAACVTAIDRDHAQASIITRKTDSSCIWKPTISNAFVTLLSWRVAHPSNPRSKANDVSSALFCDVAAVELRDTGIAIHGPASFMSLASSSRVWECCIFTPYLILNNSGVDLACKKKVFMSTDSIPQVLIPSSEAAVHPEVEKDAARLKHACLFFFEVPAPASTEDSDFSNKLCAQVVTDIDLAGLSKPTELSRWSDAFAVDNFNTNGVLQFDGSRKLPDGSRTDFELGVSFLKASFCSAVANRVRTGVVALCPRYLFRSYLDVELYLRQVEGVIFDFANRASTVPISSFVRLAKVGDNPQTNPHLFQIASSKSKRSVAASLRHNSVNAEVELTTVPARWNENRDDDLFLWSAGFQAGDVGDQVISFDYGQHLTAHVRVSVRELGPTSVVALRPHKTTLPFAVRNAICKKCELQCWQVGTDIDSSFTIPELHTRQFTWSVPYIANKQLHVESSFTDESIIFEVGSFTLDSLHSFNPTVVSLGDGSNLVIFAYVCAWGWQYHSRCLVLTDDVELFKSEALDSAEVLRSFRVARPDLAEMIREEKKETTPNETHVRFHMEGIGVSLIDNTRALSRGSRELMYACIMGITAKHVVNVHESRTELLLRDIRLNNTLPNAVLPVVFAITESVGRGGKKPAIHFAVVKSHERQEIDYYPYLSLLIQKISINVDDAFALTLWHFYSRKLKPQLDLLASSGQAEGTEQKESGDDADTEETATGKKLYLKVLRLSSIQCALSFRYASDSKSKFVDDDSAGTSDGFNPLKSVGKFFGATLGSIDQAPIQLNMLMMTDVFATSSELVALLSSRYTREGFREIYKVLGSVDVLGNPVGLFANVSTGIQDLFLEPAHGLAEGPEQFARGLARGSASLFRHSVYGSFNTVSKITGSVGNGFAQLSMDEEYIHKRQRGRNAVGARPRHAAEGLYFGAKSLGSGIFNGVVGIVWQPIKGARREKNVAGFGKGVGRGLVGVVVKPIVGVTDFFSQFTEGVRNTTRLNVQVTERTRDPRYFPMSSRAGGRGVLSEYDATLARGHLILSAVLGDLDTATQLSADAEEYIFHETLDDQRRFVFVTSRRTIMVDESGTAPDRLRYEASWSVRHATVLAMDQVKNHGIIIRFLVEPRIAVVSCLDDSKSTRIYAKLSSVVRTAKIRAEKA